MKSQYDIERMKYSDLDGKVKLPPYQRRLVWSDKQKKDFIDNISRGFPFGSILLYRYEGEKELSLIDGLQRFSTLRGYKENPEQYFTNYSEHVDHVIANIEQGHSIELAEDSKRKLREEISACIRAVLKNSERSPCSLRDTIRNDVSIYPSEEEYGDDLIDLQADLIKKAEQFLDLDDLMIPCIVFNGPEDQLPDVFANLNQGGTKLSKYQVLAAQWSHHSITLPDSENGNKLLEKVIDRYQKLIDERDLEIDGFDAQEMYESHQINLSEFCFAIGELIVEASEVFWGDLFTQDLSKKEDTINVVGYVSTAIALGVDNRSLGKLPDKLSLFRTEGFIDSLVKNMLHEYKVIQATFEQRLKLPGQASKRKYETACIADMQALSFFAELWHKHYVVNEKEQQIEVIDNYKQKGYEQSRQNLLAYCVSDVVNHQWQGAGDSRLASFYVPESASRNSYYVKLEKGLLSERLLNWYDEVTSKASVNIDKISRMLLCIFSSQHASEYTGEKYDVEHIIAKEKFKNNPQGIPGGVLGNLMYLIPKTNRGKKSRNLYFLLDHEGAQYSKEYLEMNRYPSRSQIDSAEERLAQGQTDEATRLIVERGKELLSVIANALGV